MPWIVIDAALVLTGLVVVGLSALSVWRAVKGLARVVGEAGTTLGSATDELARLQAEGAARPRPEAEPLPASLPVTSASPRRLR